MIKDPKIFADAYQLSLTTFHRTKNFPKALRPTLGRRLEEASLDLTRDIRVGMLKPAKQSGERLPYIENASAHLDEIRIMLSLARDLQVISIPAYEELSMLTRDIGKAIGGVLKYAQQT